MFSKDSEHFISVDEIMHRCFIMPKLGCGLKHRFKGLVQGCGFNILQIYLYLLNANVLGQESWTWVSLWSVTLPYVHTATEEFIIQLAWVVTSPNQTT